MKILLLAIALAASPALTQTASPSVPADTAKLAAAHKLIDTILPPASRDAMFAQMVNTMIGNMTRGIVQGQHLDEVFADHPDAKSIFAAFVDRQREFALADLKAATPALIDAEAQAYALRFTVAEMTEIQTFFASPAGQKYQQQSVAILGDPGVANWQAGVAARSQARLQTEIGEFAEQLKPILERNEDKKNAPHS